VPKAPPIIRKKVTALVAVPMSRRSTEFCTAVTMICIVPPSPAPSTNSEIATCQYGVSAPSRLSRLTPTNIVADPAIGNTR